MARLLPLLCLAALAEAARRAPMPRTPPSSPRRAVSVALAGALLGASGRPAAALAGARLLSRPSGLRVAGAPISGAPVAVGGGGARVVYRTQEGVVVKRIEARTRADIRDAERELAALSHFSGGDVVELLQAERVGDEVGHERGRTQGVLLPGSSIVYLLAMEEADTNLGELLSRGVDALRPDVKVRILLDVLRGLRKLERQGWVHRDVKPENILIFGDPASEEGCRAKLADFEHACNIDELVYQDPEVVPFAGSPLYMAPEVWRGSGSRHKIDVWAAGIVALQLFTGLPPQQLLSEGLPEELDIRRDKHFQAFQREDKEMAKLIRRMLSKHAWRRPSARRALSMATNIAKSRGIDAPEVRRWR